MSLDYWNMKLSGGYVEHAGQIKYIERVRWSDDENDDEEREYNYPEDTLPYMSFELNTGACVSFEEFTIKFPDDQWFRTNSGGIARIERNMQRQYKIAPTGEMFHILGRSNLLEALQQCDKCEYDTPESIWDWDKPNHLFSKHLAMMPQTSTERHLMYHGTAVASMTRGKDYLLLTPLMKTLPRKVDAMWGSKFDEKVEAPEVDVSASILRRFYYDWHHANTWSEFLSARRRDGKVVYFHRTQEEGVTLFVFDRTLHFTSDSDPEMLWADNQITTEMRNDIRIIMQQFKESIR